MGPQSRALLGTHPPGKHCYHDFIQAQRREATRPSQKMNPGPRGASACPFWSRSGSAAGE